MQHGSFSGNATGAPADPFVFKPALLLSPSVINHPFDLPSVVQQPVALMQSITEEGEATASTHCGGGAHSSATPALSVMMTPPTTPEVPADEGEGEGGGNGGGNGKGLAGAELDDFAVVRLSTIEEMFQMTEEEARLHLAVAVREHDPSLQWEALPASTRVLLQGLAAKSSTSAVTADNATATAVGTSINRNIDVDVGAKSGAAATMATNSPSGFPAHWGNPPMVQTRDLVEWPGGYGRGSESGTVARWIEENMTKDAAKGGGAAAEDLVEAEANVGTAEQVCPICFTEPVTTAATNTPADEGGQFRCPVDSDHVACKGCTELHLHHRISEGMSILTCPVGYDSCRHRLTEAEVQAHATAADQEALAKLRPTKEQHKKNKHKNENKTWRERWREKREQPLSRSQRREGLGSRLRSWVRTMLWTKQCSNCKARIEKSGGCTHMTCRCGHEICWCCGGDYIRKNGTRGHAGASGGLISAAFPPPREWKNACHSTKIWAVRIVGTPIGIVLAGLAVGIFLGVGSIYCLCAGIRKVGIKLRDVFGALFRSQKTRLAMARCAGGGCPCPGRSANIGVLESRRTTLPNAYDAVSV